MQDEPTASTKPSPKLSRRHALGALAAGAATLATARSPATAQSPPGATQHDHQPSPRFQRDAVRRPLISGIPISSPSIRVSTASPSPTPPFNDCGPEHSGRKARPGIPSAAISSGATFRTTGNCAGSKTTATSRCSASPSNNSQWQQLRLPGPATLLRASDTPRRALRTRRLDDHPRRQLRRQKTELAERRRPPSRRQLLVHRSPLRRPALRRHARCQRRPKQ